MKRGRFDVLLEKRYLLSRSLREGLIPTIRSHKMSINVRLLRKVKKHILAEPKRLNMGIWILNENKDKPVTGITFPKCGTVGCLAGWAVQLGEDLTIKKIPDDGISNRATELIGNIKSADVMDDPAAHSLWMDIHELFFTERWPLKFRDRYADTLSNTLPDDWDQVRAQILADVIEDFISKHPYKKTKKIKVKGA